MVFIRFNKKKYIVHIKSLLTFIVWIFSTTHGSKIRLFGSLIIGVNILFKKKEEIGRDYALNKVCLFSWIRYKSDGTRIQVFDAHSRLITKISLLKDYNSLLKEIKARQRLHQNTPKVVSCNILDGIITEEFVKIKPSKIDYKIAFDAYKILKQNLYSYDFVSITDYISNFKFTFDKKKFINFIEQNGIYTLKVTQVHGDMWYGNLYFKKNGKLVFLDWEYTSKCVFSYDLWTYYFQAYRVKHMNFNDFIDLFRDVLCKIHDEEINKKMALSFHLLHLLERYQIFLNLGKNDELVSIAANINKIIKIL